MKLDTAKIDRAVLGLLYLNLHAGDRAWKSLDWEAMDRLHQAGLISNPAKKTHSVELSEAGLDQARQAFESLFASP